MSKQIDLKNPTTLTHQVYLRKVSARSSHKRRNRQRKERLVCKVWVRPRQVTLTNAWIDITNRHVSQLRIFKEWHNANSMTEHKVSCCRYTNKRTIHPEQIQWFTVDDNKYICNHVNINYCNCPLLSTVDFCSFRRKSYNFQELERSLLGIILGKENWSLLPYENLRSEVLSAQTSLREAEDGPSLRKVEWLPSDDIDRRAHIILTRKMNIYVTLYFFRKARGGWLHTFCNTTDCIQPRFE